MREDIFFNDSSDLRATKLVLAISDFAGYTRACEQHDDAAMARLINQFYHLTVEVITRYGGRVVKFMGDACLAVFEGDAGSGAVNAMLEMRRGASTLAAAHGIDIILGARVHCGVVVEALWADRPFAV